MGTFLKGLTAGLILSTFSVAPQIAAASETTSTQDQYYVISSVSVEEVPDILNDQNTSEDFLAATPKVSPHAGVAIKIGSAAAEDTADVVGFGTIVDTAKLVWDIIKSNKPTSNVSSDTANAVPQNSNWETLVGWSAPQSHLFQVTYKNGMGMTVINFSYRVVYQYGGNIAGKGQFLNGVTIIPADVSVDWGFNFSAQTKITSVTNAGTVDDPIAAMQVQMEWSVGSMVKNITQSQGYYVRGDGQFQTLN